MRSRQSTIATLFLWSICFSFLLPASASDANTAEANTFSKPTDDCSSLLAYTVETLRKTHVSELKFGERVIIRDQADLKYEAYFIGVMDSRVYFAPTEAAGLRRPVFYLSVGDIQLQSETAVDSEVGVVHPLQAQTLIKMYASKDLEACAAQTVMTCLAHLNRLGILSDPARTYLTSDPASFFDAMLNTFGRRALEESFENTKLVGEAKKNGGFTKSTIEKMRAFAFKQVSNMLSVFGVKSKISTSFSELFRHLRQGKPAYISVNGTETGIARPHVTKWRSSIGTLDPDVKAGTIPMPTLAPSSGGFHAVYALGVLPRASGFGGFLRGHRLVILDPINGQLNVWDTFTLRFSGTAKFILIGAD